MRLPCQCGRAGEQAKPYPAAPRIRRTITAGRLRRQLCAASSTSGWPRRRAGPSKPDGSGAGRRAGRRSARHRQRRWQRLPSSVRRQAAELIESFAQERDRFLHAVEHEVVELALAVAARILRREAQMDPLLLTGAVRVALGQLSGSTQVRLRVPPAELDLWTEAIALLPNLALKPAVRGRGGDAAGRLRDRDRAGLGGPGNPRPVGRDRARLL